MYSSSTMFSRNRETTKETARWNRVLVGEAYSRKSVMCADLGIFILHMDSLTNVSRFGKNLVQHICKRQDRQSFGNKYSSLYFGHIVNWANQQHSREYYKWSHVRCFFCVCVVENDKVIYCRTFHNSEKELCSVYIWKIFRF